MPGRFTVHHQPGKGYRFVLRAADGRVIAASEHYETHQACLEGIETVRRSAPDARIDDEPPPRGMTGSQV